METHYVQELKSFSKSEILNYLGNDDDILEKLRLHNIINKNNGDNYNFHFVGVIVMDEIVLNVYPKYILNENNIKEDFERIIKVINKYNKTHEDFDNQNEDLEDISIYILSLMLFFIGDYYENGIYHNTKNIIEINGNGEINWDRTINYTYPIIKNSTPYYLELQTNYRKDNLFDYFRLLHEFVITQCSKKLNESGLLQILNLPPVELSDRIQDDFGNVDYILNKLLMELNVEFNTHKRKLLNSMHAFFSQMNYLSNEKVLTVYGVTDYEYVWEDVCSQVFDNKLDAKLYDLGLKFKENCTLREFINKVIWHIDDVDYKKNRLRPDLISLRDNVFFIFDAKYYNYTIEDGELKGQPKLESITKQYLYELAYKKLLVTNKLNVKNAFLFPDSGENFINPGYVELDIWYCLNLQNIEIIRVPAKNIYNCYLESETIDIFNELEKLNSN